ncbi:MAG: hypothetical protein AB1700_16435 [Bacillota bacterium]
MLWRLGEIVFLFASLAGFLVAVEAGFRLGVRHGDKGEESDKAHVDSLQAALLGLLALLLSFTFFMAASRFDVRKSLVLEEANAIGTTFLRSEFLPADQRREAKALLREYVSSRLAFYEAGIDPARLDQARTATTRIERRLWALAAEAASQEPRSVPVGLFVESLNNVIDLHEKRQVAFDNHVPETVLSLLLAVSVASFGLLGYRCGLTRRRRFASNALFAVLIVLVLTTILDIDRPRRGLIKVSQDSLVRLQASLERDAQ